jgi:hypothetical protein
MLWPSGAKPGTIALGVPPRSSGFLKSTPPDDALDPLTAACRPLWIPYGRLPPHESVAAPALLDPAGVTVSVRERSVWRVPRDLSASWRPVGGPLVTRIDGRTTVRFQVSAGRSIG